MCQPPTDRDPAVLERELETALAREQELRRLLLDAYDRLLKAEARRAPLGTRVTDAWWRVRAGAATRFPAVAVAYRRLLRRPR